jgi:hypothetical protein
MKFLKKKKDDIDIRALMVSPDPYPYDIEDEPETIVYTEYQSFGVAENYDFIMDYIKKSKDEFIYLTPKSPYDVRYECIAIKKNTIYAVKSCKMLDKPMQMAV